ncbi:hypothetical protein HDU67_008339 [Dinochytrium kinnereticum]|nr:hypothetical protein HDU67_008339 [Dinochytrium kinnereticum]
MSPSSPWPLLALACIASHLLKQAAAARIYIPRELWRIGDELPVSLVFDRNEVPEGQTYFTSFNLTNLIASPPSQLTICGRDSRSAVPRLAAQCPDGPRNCYVSTCNYTIPATLATGPYAVWVDWVVQCSGGVRDCPRGGRIERGFQLAAATTTIATTRPTDPAQPTSRNSSSSVTLTTSIRTIPTNTASTIAVDSTTPFTFTTITSNPLYLGLFISGIVVILLVLLFLINHYRRKYGKAGEQRRTAEASDLAKRLRVADVTGTMAAASPPQPLDPSSELRRRSIAYSIASTGVPVRQSMSSSAVGRSFDEPRRGESVVQGLPSKFATFSNEGEDTMKRLRQGGGSTDSLSSFNTSSRELLRSESSGLSPSPVPSNPYEAAAAAAAAMHYPFLPPMGYPFMLPAPPPPPNSSADSPTSQETPSFHPFMNHDQYYRQHLQRSLGEARPEFYWGPPGGYYPNPAAGGYPTYHTSLPPQPMQMPPFDQMNFLPYGTLAPAMTVPNTAAVGWREGTIDGTSTLSHAPQEEGGFADGEGEDRTFLKSSGSGEESDRVNRGILEGRRGGGL